MEAEQPDYALGQSDRELERLRVQASLVDPVTRRYFVEAGVAPGMRVLDVGSGVGDVAFLVADLVGPHGAVVGVDRSAVALEIARRRMAERPLENVSFREGDPAEMTFEEPFDAIVGRYVLQFQRDPAVMLRDLAGHARHGAVIAFHDAYRARAQSFPSVRSYDEAYDLVTETVRRLGADPHLGPRLHATFVAAGLPPPTLRLEVLIASGETSPEHVHFEMDLLHTLLPDMRRLGIVPADVVDAESWVARVLADVAAMDSVVLGRGEVGAWSRVPAAAES